MDLIKNIMNKIAPTKVVSTLKTNEYIAPKNTELDAVIRQWITNK
jgi:hypothetical protein